MIDPIVYCIYIEAATPSAKPHWTFAGLEVGGLYSPLHLLELLAGVLLRLLGELAQAPERVPEKSQKFEGHSIRLCIPG
jgi:hypothetical protein